MKRKLLNVILFAGILVGTSSIVHADEVCRSCPFDCRGIGASPRHCDDRGFGFGRCCVDLDNEGQNQLRYKDQENAYRYNNRNDPGAYDDRAGYNPGDCPVGFHVNDRKCNDEERKHGCNDLKSPTGRTCVGWHQRRR